VKVREYVYGYEWGRFQFWSGKKSWLDSVLTFWLQAKFSGQFRYYGEHYKDVHDRNVMFEIRDSKGKGCTCIMKDLTGKVRLVKVGLQAIDVR
jgi:hypothetical protein